ncbi:MAG: hypothetical protein RLZZ628_2228, partial [Bacteroidota bacterium]
MPRCAYARRGFFNGLARWNLDLNCFFLDLNKL